MSVPRLYVPGLDPRSGRIALPDGESHHVTRVLRLRPGDGVRVFDGAGREWEARLAPMERRGVARIEQLHEVAAIPEPAVRLTFAAGILKGDHMDAIVRDATMMGAAEIVPLSTEFVAVSPAAWRGDGAIERWRRVAIAAAKQCGRAVVPDVTPPIELDAALRRYAAVKKGSDTELQVSDPFLTLMFVEPGAGVGGASVSDIPVPGSGAVVLVGPEGGWSSGEIARAREAGAHLVSIGSRTIRGDAMAAVALAALWAVWKI